MKPARLVLPLLTMLAGACVEHATNPPVEGPTTTRDSTKSSVSPNVSAEKTSAPESSPKEIVLYDPTSVGNRRDPRISETIDKSEETRVLGRVFKKYLLSNAKCSGNGTDLVDSRWSGDIVPSVLSGARGAFTAAGTEQKLYVVFVGECNATHADNGGSMVLVVLQGDAVVARAEIEGGASLHGVFDIDGDGKLELLLTSGFTNQGNTVGRARLIRVAGSTIETIKDFGEVMSENCAGSFDPKKQDSSLIRAITKPGSPPEFRIEKKTVPCR